MSVILSEFCERFIWTCFLVLKMFPGKPSRSETNKARLGEIDIYIHISFIYNIHTLLGPRQIQSRLP